MDRFDAMQAFVRVVETGSFTKVAETLHMSKTTVTQLVQQLEARLRVRLLNRTTRKVGELQLKVYAAPSYLERAGTPVHPHELQDTHHRVVGFQWARTGKAAPYAMKAGAETAYVRGRYALAVDDGNAYLAAGLAGLGVLWLPGYMAEAHLPRGELVSLFEDWRIDPMPLYVAFPPNRHVSAKLRVFIDWITHLMAHHAPISDRRGS